MGSDVLADSLLVHLDGLMHEAQPESICFECAGGFRRDAKYRPLQIDPRIQDRNRWSRPSGALFGTEGFVRAITGLAGDPIGNSFGRTGRKISACFQISDGE